MSPRFRVVARVPLKVATVRPALFFGPHRPTSIFNIHKRLRIIYGKKPLARSNFVSIRPRKANPLSPGSLYHGLIRLSNFQIFLNVKREVDSGDIVANAADATGTQVLFNKIFKDIDSITCTVDSVTEPFTAIYDFADVPNPVGFKVYVFDTTGNRVSQRVSWKARGVV